MDFNLTKEQQMLTETLRRFEAKDYSFESRRRILQSAEGLNRAVWSTLAQMGLLSLQVPEEHGGMGAAGIETLLTMQAIGRALVLEPYLESAILATALIRDLGSSAQKKTLLPAMAAGELIAVPAHLERGSRYDLSRVQTSAKRRGEGYVLNGEKTVVVHGGSADLLIVSARSDGSMQDEVGISLFAVERATEGISLQSYPTLDGRRAADLTFREVEVPVEALLGAPGGAYPALARAWDVGLAAVCAEAVGALEVLFQLTLEYTKTRKQFDVPISRFQALQHRMVDMLIHVEQAKSMAYLAAMGCGELDDAARGRALSAAKVRIGQACRSVGQEAVQLHGGMGVTEELSVSHYFRRLTAIELSFGDTEHHLERFAGSRDPALS